MGVADREEDENLIQDDLEQDSLDNELPDPDPDADPDAGHDADADAGGDEDEEVVVSIGEEEPPASEEEKAAPKWVKDLRQRQKELARENAELKAKLGTGQPGATQAPKLREKPKLADHDYDEDKHAADLDKWYAEQREVEAHEARQQAAVEARNKAAKAVHENYAASKTALKVKDFQDAEDEVVAVFDQVQQSIVMAGASNPGAMVYALGKNPKKLQELASIKDPVKFAVAVGKLETEVKVTKRSGSNKPAPETTVRSGGSVSTSKATLERLEAEAERTGDRSKVIAYKRQQRAQGK